MARYSAERKAAVLRKLLPPMNNSVAEVARQEGISDVTLYALRKAAKQEGKPVPGDVKTAMLTWAHERGVKLFLIEPGKPNQNAYIESFNERFRDECLNEHWFTSLQHAKAVIESCAHALKIVNLEENIVNSYAGMQVLITGGLGFIGSSLARALVAQGASVTLVDSLIPTYGGNPYNIDDIRDRVTVNVCDVRDSFAMAYLLERKDYLFNLAGQTSHMDSMTDPQTDLDINAAAQLSILETCRKANPKIKIVFASTRQLYGKPDYLPVNEKHPIRPVDVNGINKLAGEWYHLLYNNVYGIRACALRLTNTYGPGMRVKDARQTFLGIWLRLLIEGKPIKVFGDGLQLRDFNYVDDCVEALLLTGASDMANGKVYNLGSSEVISLKALAQIMVGLGLDGSYELIPFPPERKAIDIGDYYSDFTLITQELGWTPKVGLHEGLQKTLEYYRTYHYQYWQE